MKKILFAAALTTLSSVSYAQSSEESSVTEASKSVVSGMVRFGKDLIGGVDDGIDGIDEGRKTGLSQDEAIIIDNADDLRAHIEGTVLNVNAVSDGASSIEVGFKNNSDKPVRLINLLESENVIAIDMDGYATNVTIGANPLQVTIPSRTGRKQAFQFAIPAESVKEIRIMGVTFTRQD